MIKEFTHGDTLFTVDEVDSIKNMPKSLVEYVKKNRLSLVGTDLLYTPRANYPYYDSTTPTGRQGFRPASITVSTFNYDFSEGKTNTSAVIYEDVMEEVKVNEAVNCTRVIDFNGNIAHHVEMPSTKKSWWMSLPDDATVGYEWTGAYFIEIFKFDVNKVTFTSFSVDTVKYKTDTGISMNLIRGSETEKPVFMKW